VPQDGAPVHRQKDAACYENDTCACAKDFAVNELLLPILLTFAQCIAPYTLLEMLDVFGLCIVPGPPLPPQKQSSHRVANIPRTAPDPTVGIISWSAYGTNPDVGHLSFLHVNYVQRRPSG